MLTLDAFRALHPWPEEALALGTPLEWLWHYDLDVDADELWLRIIDTSRINRAMGQAEMHLVERDGRLHGEATYGVRHHRWIEEPWDWVAARHLCCVRTYSRGYAQQVRSMYRLDTLGDGRVRYYVYFGWIPRGRVAALALRIGMRGLMQTYHRVVDEIVDGIRQALPVVLQRPPAPLSEEALRRVAAMREALREREMPAAVVDRLLEHVSAGDDMELTRIQVRALASAWRIDEDALLLVCLHATRVGLLTMSWDVICPHCRGVRQEARTLGDVPRLGSCEVCRIDFATDKANAVEITFHVHPSVRHVPQRFFCSAEPSSKVHIRVQQRLPAGESMDIAARLLPGRYRMRLRGEQAFRFLDVVARRPSSSGNEARGSDGGRRRASTIEPAERLVWKASETGDAACVIDPPVRLVNDTDEARMFILEHASWADVALRPSRLFTFQEFRDLFSEEYVAGDVQLSVGEQTILFTDIVGSTRFYAERGDPDAFMAVKKHFAVVFEIIGKHRGAVVKTIGDAAMGAFERPLDAVRAARQIHAYFSPAQRDTPIRLRISLNLGPCIAVNLNSNIDYFGSTVNLAAKLQACASAGDIAMSRAVIDAAGVMDYLRGEIGEVDEVGDTPALEKVTYSSDALDEDVDVLRWRTFAGAPAQATG